MPPPSKRNKGTKRRKKDIEDDGLPANAADVFLAYGGLNYVSASDLRACGVVNRAFKNHARRDFDKRLRECHPSLALAAETNNYNITWKDWRRFELDEVEGTGDRWSVRVSDLGGDIDVLLELKKRDGTVVWHGCTPLRRDPGDTPACVFAVPHTVLDVSKPQEGDAFEEPDTNYPGLMSYHYWCGRGDCSLQQKSICKALHGVNTSSLLQAHVVLRRRSTGQMVTVLSTSKPNQVIGEDYGNEVGEYFVIYNCNSLLYEEDDRLGCEIGFDIYCSETLDAAQDSIRFSTHRREDESEDACVSFRFVICDEDQDEDGEELVLRAMHSWRWG